jgi:hypothetical protein
MITTTEDPFMKIAREEGEYDISAGVRLSAVGLRPLLSMPTVRVIVRATGRLDEPTRSAMMRAVDGFEAVPLAPRDREEAADTLDRLREELSEAHPDARRVRRFVNNLAAISEPAAAPLREHEPIKAMLAG